MNLKGAKKRLMLTVAATLVFGLLSGPEAPAWADDAKAMLKQVNGALRQAEKDMFAGKTDNAIASLDGIRELLLKLKAADPNNGAVKSAENKYQKLVKDLERRTGKDLGGGTLSAAASSTETALPSKGEAKPLPEKAATSSSGKTAAPAAPNAGEPETTKGAGASAVKLPYAARKPLQDARNQLNGLAGNLDDLADPDYRGDKDQLAGRIDKKLEAVRKSLEEAQRLAAEKGVTSHPEFDQAKADLAAAEKRAAGARGGYEQARAAVAASADEVTADVDALKAEYDRLRPVFDRASGVVIYYNDLAPAEELIEQIDAFEKNDLGPVTEKMKVFAAKYGTSREEIDKKADAMGYSGQTRAGFPYTELAAGIQNLEKTRTVMADDLVRKAIDMKDRSASGIHDFYRLDNQKKIKEWGEMAARFDPENPRVKEFMAGVDAWMKEDMQSLNAKIDKATWPKQAGNAPANAKELTKVIFAFLQQESDKLTAKDKDPRTMLAVVVTGPWRVFQKNLLGEPIQYGLPILGAVQHGSEKALSLARVYELTVLTNEYKGVKMAPPFIGSAVGNSWYIRPSEVK